MYSVYKGERGGNIVYIGTTIQAPADRFRWHKSNGKNLKFTVLSSHKTADAMIDEEFRLIKKHKPKLNKITHRKQNLNAKLPAGTTNSRKGDAEWCQGCFKRRVNEGYEKCYWCHRGYNK